MVATPTRIDALHTLGGNIPLHIDCHLTKDDRKNKLYHRLVSFTLELELEKGVSNYEARRLAPSATSVGRRVARAVAAGFGPTYDGSVSEDGEFVSLPITIQHHGYGETYEFKLLGPHSSGSSDWGPYRLFWTFTLRAEKPSKIISQAAARDFAETHLAPHLREALREEIRAKREGVRQIKAAKEANRIGKAAADRLLQVSLAATRYKQRLAALEAEVEAEIKAQADAIREEVRLRITEDKPDFEPEAVAYALDHFPRRLVAWAEHFRTPTEWDVKDLFPENEEQS